MTRRGFLRFLGSVAAAGAVAAVGATGPGESAHARRHGKKRRKGHTDRPATRSAIEAMVLEPDLAEGGLDYAGGRCRWRYVCYPDGVCSRRRVCWY
jgi:hypothetical protein